MNNFVSMKVSTPPVYVKDVVSVNDGSFIVGCRPQIAVRSSSSLAFKTRNPDRTASSSSSASVSINSSTSGSLAALVRHSQLSVSDQPAAERAPTHLLDGMGLTTTSRSSGWA